MTEQQKLKSLVKKLAKNKFHSNEDFSVLSRNLANQLSMPMPSKFKILKIYGILKRQKKIKSNQYFEKQLKKRPVRSLSGVAVVSVLTKPWPCPGRCIYCPSEKGIPKSYLSGEPAVERAKLLKYDPYLQVRKRIETLGKIGHPTDKIELIVIGGTWSYLPKQYQNWFIKRCFEGANSTNNKKQITNNKLEWLQKINERVKHRIIGLTLETRPDYITSQEILRMRKLGCTRVEIGVQVIDDKILKKNKRGHGVREIIRATKLLKDAGFKICYHIMPGLPGSTIKKDLVMFKTLFTNPDFRPDMLKVYPCVVTKGSALYKLWKEKKYKPYSDKELINLLVRMKLSVPPYVRINRLIRDIPSWQIKGGSKISNLREVVQAIMKTKGLRCQCIRCREVKDLRLKVKDLRLIKTEYEASGGKEIFLSFEDPKFDKLAAFLRLRLPGSKVYSLPFKVLQDAALIREIHTYGQLIPLNHKSTAVQHLGIGKKLIKKAEEIAGKNGYKKIAVIAGIGVRQYYQKLGYYLKNTYMVKDLV